MIEPVEVLYGNPVNNLADGTSGELAS